MTAVNAAKLNEFVGKMLGDLGGATSVPLVRIGDRLGLYVALRERGSSTPEELSDALGLAERYVREWLCAQAASGYVTWNEQDRTFSLTTEQAMVFADPDSPVYMLGAFDLVASMLEAEDRVIEAFRTGEGVGWGELSGCLFCATGRFFRPGYLHNLVQSWLPALDGVTARLDRGARVADVGCGVGFSTLLMARAFPNSEFVGFDFHEPSVRSAGEHAAEHGLADRVRFEVAMVQEIGERDFDLVTSLDCLHDMGDPRGAARHIHGMLKSGGTWMVVEPIAGDELADNLHPVGRLYYNASTMICVPTSLAQPVGEGLGAQAGEKRLAEVIRAGGFHSVRRAAEGPFNMILEAMK